MAGDQPLLHRPIKTEGYKTKLCLLCQINKTRTKSGWLASSRYRCDTCNVPLCTGKRDCFTAYHQMLAESLNQL